jgi:hypothetical protein
LFPEILRVLTREKLGLEINQRFYRIKKNPSIGTDGSFEKIKKLYRSSKGFASKVLLSMKEGCLFVLFCLHLWDPVNWDALDRVLGLFGKLSRRRGASAWFHGIWTCGAKVLEYWIIHSLKIKLNHSWKFWRNWNVPLVLLERSCWARFNGIYLVRFGFRMWEILIFKWYLSLKIQINSKKPGFGRKNQLITW